MPPGRISNGQVPTGFGATGGDWTAAPSPFGAATLTDEFGAAGLDTARWSTYDGRSQVLNEDLKLSEAAGDYQVLIRSLLSIRDSAAQLAGDNALGERERAAAEVSRIKDFMSQRRVVILQIFNQQAFTPQLRTDYIATTTGESLAEEDFDTVATPTERDFFEQTVSGSVLRLSDTYQG